MKKFKEYFKMMITAVICLAMSLVPGKKKGQAVELLGGAAAAGTDRNREAFLRTNAGVQGVTESAGMLMEKAAVNDYRYASDQMQRFRQSSLIRHVFVPTVGPGDRYLREQVPWSGDCVSKNDSDKIIIFPGGFG